MNIIHLKITHAHYSMIRFEISFATIRSPRFASISHVVINMQEGSSATVDEINTAHLKY